MLTFDLNSGVYLRGFGGVVPSDPRAKNKSNFFIHNSYGQRPIYDNTVIVQVTITQ